MNTNPVPDTVANSKEKIVCLGDIPTVAQQGIALVGFGQLGPSNIDSVIALTAEPWLARVPNLDYLTASQCWTVPGGPIKVVTLALSRRNPTRIQS